MNPTLKSLLRRTFHASGALGLVRLAKRGGLRILMYHGFGADARSRAALERQCAHLQRHYRCISLTQAAQALQASGGLADHSLVVTVDDGYRNFYDVAYPIFRQYNIPAIVYLTTDFLDQKDWLWVDRVAYGFAVTRKAAVELEIGGTRTRFDLPSPASRPAIAQEVMERCKLVPDLERLRVVERLGEALQVEFPQHPTEQFAPLTWDQVREAARNGMEFGAHTLSHPVLSQVADAAKLHGEIAGSKRRIEEELGRPVLHFCYPNGRITDISPQSISLVRQAGYTTAVTTVAGVNDGRTDPFLLKRIAVDPGQEDLYFREQVTAFRLG